jgi:hypothetical protein
MSLRQAELEPIDDKKYMSEFVTSLVFLWEGYRSSICDSRILCIVLLLVSTRDAVIG